MNIYQAKMIDRCYPDVYYILANNLINARLMIENDPNFDKEANDIREYYSIPTTDISILLKKYRDIDLDKIPMAILFIRDNKSYRNGNKPIFYNYPIVVKWFTELFTGEWYTDYCKWVNEGIHIGNK